MKPYPKRAPRAKRPTWTSIVMKKLEEKPDNFMTAEQLRNTTGANHNQMSATLIHLRKCNAVDCVIEPNGVAWWFATTQYDDRQYQVNERAPEYHCRCRRSKKGKVTS